MTIETLPDTVTALRVFLAADPDVATARTVNGQLGSMNRAQGPAVKYPALKVYRAGGPAADAYLDHPLVQIEAIGAPNDTSDATDRVLVDLLRTVQAAIYRRMRGETTGSVRISAVETITALQWGWDDTTKQNRYFLRLVLTAHAVPA